MKTPSLIDSRFKKPASPKMASLAKRAQEGELSTFSGFFQVHDLTPGEKEALENTLRNYLEDERRFQEDLSALIQLTSEIKAITHQAALLHGERIARAQKILAYYREGAFSAWLIAAYGNRQTPYNLLLFYTFFEQLPPLIKPKAELMARQAIYTLASRKGDLTQKIAFIDQHHGEKKEVLLEKIRALFPLEEEDRRREDPVAKTLQTLAKAISEMGKIKSLSSSEKQKIRSLIEKLESLLYF